MHEAVANMGDGQEARTEIGTVHFFFLNAAVSH